MRSPPAVGGPVCKNVSPKMVSDYVNMMPKDQGNVRYILVNISRAKVFVPNISFIHCKKSITNHGDMLT